MVYPSNTPKHSSTFETWKKLINIAEHSIEIGSFYWSLRKWNQFPNESQKVGLNLFSQSSIIR